ncbi:MAG: radical SAM protein [Magnetococcales bacterium]|nr:radical SAM protein [Magnetococcales bacterium]
MGRRCPHSCTFCFYSFYDNSDDQFHYLRRAPWVSGEALRRVLDSFVSWGLTHFDYTGGEPSLHPECVEITRYAHRELGLKGRMISLGMFLLAPRPRGGVLLDDLLDAGLDDFLFSFHTADPALFKQLTGAELDKLHRVMDNLDDRGFSYCINIVVSSLNEQTLAETVAALGGRRVRMVNFIMMRMDWGLRNRPNIAIAKKGRLTHTIRHLTAAVDLLNQAGIAVNIRYAPYCLLKGYERHIVGYKGLQLDPYEWRNGTLAASEGVPYLKCHTLNEHRHEVVPRFENDPVYKLVFGPQCAGCGLRPICDGADAFYIEEFGWEEFVPYAPPVIHDYVHFRHDYPGVFLLKEQPHE